jgi:hypothetical protein
LVRAVASIAAGVSIVAVPDMRDAILSSENIIQFSI